MSRQSLAQHILLLDGAVDRFVSDLLFRHREDGSWAGVAVATDESPPKQPRFRGLRFQITVMYLGIVPPVADWESSSSPPLKCLSMLADIMHCPGKRGTDVSQVLEKQLGRIGLNCYDVVSGTGDGGGENEGHSGIHSHFENLCPGYVRRRCLPHIAWRTAEQAIRASELDYKALCSYLGEGITWTRLREIATRDPRDGGLGLFRDGSRPCKDLFDVAPGSIVTSRPETDLMFLKFLRGKEHLLHLLARRDLEQRTGLGPDIVGAVTSLGDIKQRLYREILSEVLERCFFLYYWSGKHDKVAMTLSWTDLVDKACGIILDLAVTPKVLQKYGYTQEDLEALDAQPRTWVEVVVLHVVGEQDLMETYLHEALDFHRATTTRAAGHLALVGDNTFRTPWTAAKLLSTDPGMARAAAREFAHHLDTARPGNRTLFEAHIFESENLYLDLVAFGAAEPQVLLWKGHGRFQSLYRFLAVRFLLAPDHVLDAERIHARWQWLCQQQKGNLRCTA